VNQSIVSLRDVRRDYALGAERVHALQGVTLDVERGDYVAIVGPSGCGKSTLLNLIGVIDHPTSGTVEIAGKRVDAMSDREATWFRLHNIGFVFQRFYLMPILSALENVALPMAEAKVARQTRVERAAELLAYVGLGTVPPSFPEVSSNVSRSPARWRTGHRSFWPTSRRASSMRAPVRRSSRSSSD
jgi:putative ABC transport system ATP-binding protein